jgi:dTDP-4-amino-4,6-dideoxygalactose transaminase
MFKIINQSEQEIASFYGSKYAVATDSCTHALELCLRLKNYNNISVPKHTYISIPFTMMKLGKEWNWYHEEWHDYYYLKNTNIIDAAVLWKENSYISSTYMCLSFQFRKHLGLGRGGMILLDNEDDYDKLKTMVIDGRDPFTRWFTQDIKTIGYHYYMTPETAQLGLEKLGEAKERKPILQKWTDYPDLTRMTVFKNLTL